MTETVTVTPVRGIRLYTRVFTSILDSSINVQRVPPSARWLWITMLLIADNDMTGVVDIPIERLAAKAGLTLDQTLEGLAILSAPDTESRTEDENGRRIVPIRSESSRGWRLVNWQKYKEISKEEQVREETRKRVAKHRAAIAGTADVTEGNGSDVTSNASESEAPSEALSEVATKKGKTLVAAPHVTARQLVEEFKLEDKHREWARAKCPSIDADYLFEKWLDGLRSNGYKTNAGPVKDPASSWRTWMRNAQERAGGQSGRGRSDSRGAASSGADPQPARPRYPAITPETLAAKLEQKRLSALSQAAPANPVDPVRGV